MKNKKKISAIILAGTMMLSMGTTAFAADAPIVKEASITKNFEMAEGIATPKATFKFTATKITEDAPTATIKDISFVEGEKATLAEGINTVSKPSAISFDKDFPHAGEYVYTVTETKEAANVEGEITYSTDTYTLRVYVMNSDNGELKIRNMTAEKGTSDGTNANKVTEIAFTNTYKKNAALKITNHTTGELADKTEDFHFTITITPSKTEENPTSYTGMIGKEKVTVPVDTATTFDLHEGETLSFDSLPAGTRYVVKEEGKAGYTPSVDVIENDVETVDKIAKESEGISSAEAGNTNLVGEKTNTVTFTNEYKAVPTTGIIMNNLPFILVISVAVLALGALAVLKKQKFDRR